MQKNIRLLKQMAVFLFVSILFCNVPSFAQIKQFDFNARCDKAYKSIISLRINEGISLLEAEKKENPNNLIPIMLDNYDDCLTLLFNGDIEAYKKRKVNLSMRLSQLEKGNINSPWYRYSKAVLYFQWATVRIRFGEYFNAGTEFRKSFLLLKENDKKFPDFKYNKILLGIEEAIVGTVPDKYKWVANMLGMKGSIKKGTTKIVQFLNTQDGSASHLREEAIFFYCYLKSSLLSQPEQTWKYINGSKLDTKNNLLFAFMKANLALSQNNAAVAEKVLLARNTSNNYLNAPIFDYLHGVALMQKNDESCVMFFLKFIKNYKGNMYVKDAYQKISLFYAAQQDLENALKYKELILSNGNLQIDADKQAQRYAQNNYIPNHVLLQARLYCDGGYYTKALNALNSTNEEQLTDLASKLEYNYRYARIYTLLNNFEKAIPYYEKTIEQGADRQEHFAARSALELGQIYESLNNKEKAVFYNKKCISMKNHDYKQSLDQKAKAGLGRLGNL